jgi:hypothetical protein
MSSIHSFAGISIQAIGCDSQPAPVRAEVFFVDGSRELFGDIFALAFSMGL